MKLSITVTCIFSLLTGIVTTSLMPMEEGITQNTKKSSSKNLHEIYIKNAQESKKLPSVMIYSVNKNLTECKYARICSSYNNKFQMCPMLKDLQNTNFDVSQVFQKHRNDPVCLYYLDTKKSVPLFILEKDPIKCTVLIAFLVSDSTGSRAISDLIKDFDRYGVSVSHSDIFSYLCKRYVCERHKELVPKIRNLNTIMNRKKQKVDCDVHKVIYQLINILHFLNHEKYRILSGMCKKINKIKDIMKTTKEYRISSPWDTDLGLFLDDIISAFDKCEIRDKDKETLKNNLSAVLDDIKKRWGISSSQEKDAIDALCLLDTPLTKKQKVT